MRCRQTCGKQASGLFFRGDSGHILHDGAILAQGTEKRPVSGFEGREVEPGSGNGCHRYAISSEHGISL